MEKENKTERKGKKNNHGVDAKGTSTKKTGTTRPVHPWIRSVRAAHTNPQRSVHCGPPPPRTAHASESPTVFDPNWRERGKRGGDGGRPGTPRPTSTYPVPLRKLRLMVLGVGTWDKRGHLKFGILLSYYVTMEVRIRTCMNLDRKDSGRSVKIDDTVLY